MKKKRDIGAELIDAVAAVKAGKGKTYFFVPLQKLDMDSRLRGNDEEI